MLIVLLLLATTFLACGPSTQPAPAPAEDAKPRSGGVLNVRQSGDPFDWDLSYSGKTSNNWNGLGMAYNQLLGFKVGPDVAYGELILKPELAERWESSADAKVFTFYLRRGVRFAPSTGSGNIKGLENGRDLTAADVKWTFEYYTRSGPFKDKGLPGGQLDSLFEGLQGVEVIDPYMLKLSFKEPFAPFLNYAAWDWTAIVPHEIYDQDGHLKDRAAGTGPFQLDQAESQRGTRWVWKKHAGYWESGKPYLDEVRWLVLPEDGTAMAALQTKQLDVLGSGGGGFPSQLVDQLRRDMPQVVVYQYLSPTAQHLYIQSRTPPLSDVRLRKAISLALDRDELVRVATGGQGSWALAGALPDTFTEQEVKQLLRYDPEAARKLVAEAGYPNGIELEFIFSSQYGQRERTQAELVQAQLKKAGIHMDIKVLNDTDFTRRRRAGQFHLAPATKALAGDVDSYLSSFVLASGLGGSSVDDPTMDQMVLAQRREPDPARRRDLVRQAVRYANENAFNLALLFGTDFQFTQPNVRDYYPNWGCRACYSPDTWLAQ